MCLSSPDALDYQSSKLAMAFLSFLWPSASSWHVHMDPREKRRSPHSRSIAAADISKQGTAEGANSSLHTFKTQSSFTIMFQSTRCANPTDQTKYTSHKTNIRASHKTRKNKTECMCVCARMSGVYTQILRKIIEGPWSNF